nr:hypothetical protein [Pieris rapae granulovirus]
MEKNVDIVIESFEAWTRCFKEKNKKERLVCLMTEQIEELVLNFLDQKRKKYIKIDNINKILFGGDKTLA